MESRLSRWCDGLMEIGWLAAIVATPLFFNIHSDRVFEPDKLTLLRSIALIMAVAWLVKFIDGRDWEDLDWLRWSDEDSIWRMPFILPVFLLVIIYLVSTLFSVTRIVSWAGSYQRLQGTYTTLSYIVVFALMAHTMRSRAQVSRVVTAVIITSIPVAFYGLLQRFGLDPLPWGGNTQRRIAGHMGNAIFIAAYLIMAIPPTVARIVDAFTNILSDEELSYADVIRSSIYIFTLAIQLLAIYWSRSRGPMLGLAVALFAFVLILLVRLRNTSRDPLRTVDVLKAVGGVLAGTAVAFVVLQQVMGLLSGRVATLAGPMGNFAAFVASLFLVVIAFFIMIAVRRGWRWLWLSWLILALVVAGWLGLFNFADELEPQVADTPVVGQITAELVRWQDLEGIGRLGRLLEAEGGTGRVRVLIWEGTLELLAPHEPLQFPEGGEDQFNILRPLIGYGPESMYVAYNRFYPPELATIEARNASPDRAHNETFDALVITGGLGFLIWQFLYLSVFYYGFKWLGVVRSRRDRNLLIVFWIGGAALTTIAIIQALGMPFLGVAIPFGSIIGLVLYLVYYALSAQLADADPTDDDPFQVDGLLMIALVTAVLAHYVEIHFGIAIAATRLHFFAYVGLMFIVGHWLPYMQAVAEERKRRRSRRTRTVTADGGVWNPVLLAGLLLALMIGVIGFEFTTYSLPPDKTIETAADLSAGEIFHQSLFVNARKDFVDSPFVFLMILLTWILGSLVSLSEMVKRDEFGLTAVAGSLRKDRHRLAIAGFGLMLLVTLGGVVYQYVIAPPATVSATLGRTGLLIWTLLTAYATAWLYLKRENARLVAGIVTMVGLAFVLPLLVAGAVLAAFLLAFGNGALLYLLWDGEWREILLPPFVMSAGALAVGFFYTYIQAGLVKSSIAPQTSQEFASVAELRVFEAGLATNFLTMFYVFVIAVLLLGAFVLANRSDGRRRRRSLGSTAGFVALLLLAPLSLYALSQTNVRVIQADVVFKRGKPFDQQAARLGRNQENLQNALTAWDATIAIYEEAIDLAPREDFYYLFLGRAYLERSTIEPDPAQQQALFEEAETRLLRAQDINPLNTDHTANLARLNTRLTQLAQDPAQKERRLELAESYYQDALSLSPQNSIIRNEYASLVLELKRDCDQALEIYDRSVEIDPFFSTSYFARADAYVTCAARQEAEAQTGYYQVAAGSLEEGLEREPGNARAWLQAGQIYQELGDFAEAVEAYDEALAQDGRNQLPAWNINYLKALAYVGMEDDAKAETAAKRALNQAPPEATPQIEQLLQQVGAEIPSRDESSGAPQQEIELSGERPLAQLEPAARNNYFDSPPPMVIDTAKTYEAIIVTEKGDMRFRLFDDQAPLTVNNFVFLAQQGFYDGTTFHRVLEGFMAQGGDPTGSGAGGPGYQFQNEVDNSLTFSKRGILAMANAGPDTNGSQFFITFGPTPQLNGSYTIFGEVISGDAVLDQITRRDPTQNPDFSGDRIERVEIVEVEG